MESTDISVRTGGEGNSTGSLMEKYLNDPSHDYRTLKYGDVMDGVIMRVDRDEILVDIGSKSEGVVPSKEFSSLTSSEKQALAVGETVLVFVVQPENQEGHATVSIDRARQEKSWRRLQEIYDENGVIDAEVVNYNKGGLLVNLDGVRGFVPASQVTEIRGSDEVGKQAEMARLIGTSLPLKVIEINRHRNRLILSERQAMQEKRDEMKDLLIKELQEGEVRRGRVSSICDFGAFVDIGGADGLVHLSELSWSRVRHPSEVLKIGEEVDVYVLGINPQEKKIALSIKRTQAEPWSRVANAYDVGQLVRGTVTQLANFGAFARIEDGIEGLIHVSELTDERIAHPKQVVEEGQDLILRIIRIDPERRRMGLSLRRALDTPDDELIAALGEGALEERDRISVEIASAIEREGLEAEAEEDENEDEGVESGSSAPVETTAMAAAVVEAQAEAGEAGEDSSDSDASEDSAVEAESASEVTGETVSESAAEPEDAEAPDEAENDASPDDSSEVEAEGAGEGEDAESPDDAEGDDDDTTSEDTSEDTSEGTSEDDEEESAG
jgi:small subunit ribosomal protein S1